MKSYATLRIGSRMRDDPVAVDALALWLIFSTEILVQAQLRHEYAF